LRTLTEVIGHDEFDRSIIPHLTQLSTDKLGRVKRALINFMPELAQFLDSSLFKDRLESVIMNLMSDPVFQIREEAIQLLLTLKDKNKQGGPFD
jgi:serine/threonine-protein phosphatase 2A regulatory subunit A